MNTKAFSFIRKEYDIKVMFIGPKYHFMGNPLKTVTTISEIFRKAYFYIQVHCLITINILQFHSKSRRLDRNVRKTF